MIYKASRFWGSWKSLTKFFIPDRIEILNDKIVIKKRRWLGLKGTDEEILFSKIASVRLVKGVFTGAVLIETIGRAVRDMEVRAFNKKTAYKVIKLIKLKGGYIKIKIIPIRTKGSKKRIRKRGDINDLNDKWWR